LITDPEGIQFLQWCLPRLHLRWPGFRKVRRQVYQRITRRLQELGLPNLQSYRCHLEDHPAEWARLDSLCWIHISRFYRDRSVFQHLEREVLPQLAQRQVAAGEDEIRLWSAGCAGGEEPYTIAVIWRHRLAEQFSSLRVRIVATDIDPQSIRRAERGCYKASSVKELPAEWRAEALVTRGEELCLKNEYRGGVTFLLQDIREGAPEGLFQLILCRNLAFTYFDETLQKETMRKIADRLAPGGALVIGNLESLPDGPWDVEPWSKRLGVYRKALAPLTTCC
jgi:chemotaxis protein methyltransferase CheR